ncbi:hypothetical protein DSO57_1027832 [Entomophthora muscae]|uniref:Uncharacterized protein n=1 Tax=Entomophthora muscae TaxID=34485 RepID=A0ACC2RGG5_9FUNG|nr:hypothetical protein DSO57_1027832 [Entomophthora muscae]
MSARLIRRLWCTFSSEATQVGPGSTPGTAWVGHVRNIPDINQILTREKCWNQVEKCSTGGLKFDREFPPLSGEKKNQNLEKTDFYGSRNNLTSGQAPAAAAQTPATLHQPPARPASQPPASPLPASRAPSLPPADPLPASHPLAHPSPSGPAACPQATCPLPNP